jgi:hypothetical protein
MKKRRPFDEIIDRAIAEPEHERARGAMMLPPSKSTVAVLELTSNIFNADRWSRR